MNNELVKEDCDRISEKDLLQRVKALCRENGIPTGGWKVWFWNSPGPKCCRRIYKGSVRQTAYIHPFWIDIYAAGGIVPIARGGLV